MRLIIGNRNYSSWSLRAWLALAESGADFEEHRVALFTPESRAFLLQVSGAGRVPILVVDDGAGGRIAIHDSAAILEYVAEEVDGAVGWPHSTAARAWARSISAEMHSGFFGLRSELPLNIRARFRTPLESLSDETRTDIDRIYDIWTTSRQRFGDGGCWLLGERSLADFVFAPVLLRFRTYSIGIPEELASWASAVLGLDSLRSWIEAAEAEEERLAFIDRIGMARSPQPSTAESDLGGDLS